MNRTQLNDEDIFKVAVQIASPSARQAYLQQACGGDQELLHRVSELLEAEQDASQFLEVPAMEQDATANRESDHKVGSRVGPYKILQEIGTGGFGVVFMAEQVDPIHRRVAIKIIKPGMDSREIIARFEAERQALALMDHPNIARVLDAGATDTGRPYFVMELIRGTPITQFADEQNLSTKDRLKLLITICRAVQHAHQKGIIHRDIKPSNIMITLHDGEPVPKIIDFGIAKALSHRLTDKTLFTRYGAFVGTPQYMSPEQAEMSGLDVDTRSDVYSLGVLAYELLVGTPPFDGHRLVEAGIDEMRRVIREEEPHRPSHLLQTLDAKSASTVATHRSCQLETLRRELRGDLDWIIMRALEKDRGRRYESPAEMANDVERFLNDQPVEACPPSFSYRTRKTWRRHRVSISAAAIVTLTLLGGLASVSAALVQTRAALQEAADAGVHAEDAKRQAETAKVRAENEREVAVTETENARQTLDLVLDLLSNCGADPQTGREYTVSQALDRLAEQITEENRLQPGTIAELHLALGRAFLASGQRDRSLQHYELAWKLAPDAWNVTDSRFALARRQPAYLARSLERLKAAVEADRQLANPSELVKSLTLLGAVAAEQQVVEMAKPALREAVGLFEDVPGNERIQFVEIPHLVLADLLRSEGAVDAATHFREKGTAIAKQRFWTTDRPWYRLSLNLAKSERIAAAGRAFEIARSCTGTVNGTWIKGLGHAHRNAGAFLVADRCYDWGHEVAGTDNVVWNLLNRARLRMYAGDLPRAAEFYERGVGLPNNGNIETYTSCWARQEYAFLLLGADDRTKASEQFREALKRLEDIDETDPIKMNEVALFRYTCLLMTDRHDDIYGEIVEYLQDEHPRGEWKDYLYVTALFNSFPVEVAGYDSADTMERVCRARQPYHPGYHSTLYEDFYVRWMTENSQAMRAEQFLDKLIVERDANFGPTNLERAWTRVRLAQLLLKQGSNLEKASVLLRDALSICKTNSFVPQAKLDSLKSSLAEAEAAAADKRPRR